MAPLTWRDVAAPDFSGATEAQRTAAQLLSNGFGSAISALDTFGKGQDATASSAFARKVASYGGDTAALNRDLSSGTILSGINGTVDPDLFKWAGTREATALANASQAESNSQTKWADDRTRSYEAARPALVDLTARIRSLTDLGTPEGLAQARDLMTKNSGVLAAAGYTPDQVNGQANTNMQANTSGLALTKAQQEFGDANVDRDAKLQAEKLISTVVPNSVSVDDAAKTIRNANVDPKVAAIALGSLQTNGPALFGPDVDPQLAILDQATKNDTNSLIGLVDQNEGGGRYDTLYGNAQRDGGAFAGVDVSKQTIGQLKQFSSSDGAYGQHQKDKLGYVATPMGRFQIVGTTLANAAKEMGLPDDTVFTPEVQDAMFQHLVDQRISGPKSMDGKIAGLRQEWAGFKDVPDNVLASAITAYQSGDKSALTGYSRNAGAGLAPAVNPASSVDTAINAALKSTQGLPTFSADQNQALYDQSITTSNQAQSILDSVTADSMFGNDALLTELTTRPNKGKQAVDLATDLMKRANTDENNTVFSTPNDIIDEINRVKDNYGIDADMAAAFIGNAIQQNWWITRPLAGQTHVDRTRLDQLISTFYNKDGATPSEKIAPTINRLRASEAKQATASTLAKTQALVQQAQKEYFNAQEKAKTHPGVKVDGFRLRYQSLLAKMQDEIAKAQGNPLLLANSLGRR